VTASSSDPVAATDGAPPPRRRLALFLLFLAGLFCILDRQILNILSQQIKDEMGLSDAALGLLTGTAFGLFYSTLGIPIASLADRYSRVRILWIALALWSAFTGLCGMATTFVQLFVTRMGVGEAGCQPASISLVADLYPPHRRASATGLLLANAPAGAAIGMLIGGYLSAWLGWCMAFIVAAAPGLMLAAIIALAMAGPARAGPAHAPVPLRDSVALLVGRRTIRWLTAVFVAETFCVYTIGAWLPALYFRTRGMSGIEVGLSLGPAMGAGGMLGTMLAGALADRLDRHGMIDPWTILQVMLLLNLVSLAVAVFASAAWLSIAAAFLLNLSLWAYLGPLPVLIQDHAGVRTRGLALGGIISISNITSMGIGVPVVGAVSDSLQARFGTTALGYALVMSVAVVVLLGVVAVDCGRRSARVENPPAARPAVA